MSNEPRKLPHGRPNVHGDDDDGVGDDDDGVGDGDGDDDDGVADRIYVSSIH